MTIMITLTDIVHFYGENKTLNGVSLNIIKNKITGIIGPTGSGKSVLLKVIAGLEKPAMGDMQLDYKNVSLMFQEGALFDSLSVLDNVAFPLTNGSAPITTVPYKKRKVMAEKAYEMLQRVGLGKAYKKFPSQLSGGMRRRLSLARALVSKPDLILLDDPTSGLDPVASTVIMDLIKEIQEEFDLTVVIVSHDLRRLLPICNFIHCIFDRKTAFSGTMSELLEKAPYIVRHFVSCRYDYVYSGNSIHESNAS